MTVEKSEEETPEPGSWEEFTQILEQEYEREMNKENDEELSN